MHNHTHCINLLDAQMSLPYSIAVALLNDTLQVDSFKPESVEPQVWEICDKIEIYIDEEADKDYPKKGRQKLKL